MKVNNKQSGFSIIEVLIVLAIAGLIMVIVFLAVPALQRNSRNTQRTNDASRVAAAIGECTANSNGNLDNCNTAAEIAAYITMANNQQLITFTAGADPATNPASPDGVVYFQTSTQCNAAGSDDQAGGGARAFSLVYLIETSGATTKRCING